MSSLSRQYDARNGKNERSGIPHSALPLSPFSVAVYAAFGLLSFLPFVIEAKEALVWKYYISKM